MLVKPLSKSTTSTCRSVINIMGLQGMLFFEQIVRFHGMVVLPSVVKALSRAHPCPPCLGTEKVRGTLNWLALSGAGRGRRK